MKIKQYTENDFITDVYNLIVLLPEKDKELRYIRRPAWYLMNRFIENKEWILATKMREVVGDFNNKGPI